MDLIETLKKFGFTGQEALAYLTLLKGGGLTGYEAAKRADISRSNAYAALASLVEKGRASKSGDEPARYVAVSKDELLISLRREFDQAGNVLEKELPDRVEDDIPYITISGLKPTVDRLNAMILLASARVYVSIGAGELALVKESLANAAKKGIRVVVISDIDPGISGVEFFTKVKEPGHVNIIADTRELITGVINPGADGQCLYSKNPHLVRLMREAFLNEIELIKIRNQ